jgi:hypothetical protein
MIWREKRIILLVLGVLLAANTVFFFTYRVRYEQRLRDVHARSEESAQRLKRARQARSMAERQYAGYRKVQHDIEEVYNDRWSTPLKRLTPLISEVQRLAAASQLVPPSYSFTKTESKSDTTGALNTSVVGITFTVQGNYQQIRRLINLLELSPQFVIIDSIALSSPNEQTLTLNLHVKTLFRDTSPARTGATSTQQL